MSEPRPPQPVSSVRAGSLPGEPVSSPLTLVNARQCPTCSGRYPADFKVCPRDATPLEDALPDTDDPMIGQVLSGTYEILRVIGEGGMGRVYEARHSRLANKRFAVKMLHGELARQPEVVTRFQREAEAASALSHPNVVSVFDVNTAPDGRPYIVAELLEGEELGDYLERAGKLGAPVAIPIVRQVCRALERAHQHGIVHRDVKPENVFLVAGEGAVKVLDFGISKLSESTANLTKTGMVMGTPDYMAPEQARGDKVDKRADVYALGAILYRALTGRKPFEGLDAMATLTAALVQEPTRPSQLEPSIPLALEHVIQRAMAKEPSERYQSVSELDEALSEFDPGTGVASVLGGKENRIDVSGRTVISHTGALPVVHTERSSRSARFGRPTLALFTGLGFVWLVSSIVVSVAALIRQVRGENLTASEAILVPVGVVAATITPAIVWIRHLLREVWPSTPRAVETAMRLRRAVLASASAYGVSWLFIALLESVVHREGTDLAQPRWLLVTFAAALLAAVLSWTLLSSRRR